MSDKEIDSGVSKRANKNPEVVVNVDVAPGEMYIDESLWQATITEIVEAMTRKPDPDNS